MQHIMSLGTALEALISFEPVSLSAHLIQLQEEKNLHAMLGEGKDTTNDVDFENDISNLKNKLIPRITISENTGEVFSCKFSEDGQFLAAGCGDGAIRVFNAFTGGISYNLQGGSSVSLPTMALAFRPTNPIGVSRTKNVLLAANAAGPVQHWHITSGKCLHTYEDAGNQVYAVDYCSDGSKFCSGGRDCAIRIYDEATKAETHCLKGGLGFGTKATPGHSNRIFSCKFKQDDPNIVVSGGWDDTVQIWDIRAGGAIRMIYGPHICGESVDMCGTEILTGSWRPEDQLEIWDFTTAKKVSVIEWNPSKFAAAGQQACMIYAAQFSKEGQGKYILAGGSGANEAKVFDHKNGNAVIGTVTGLSRGVFAVDFSPDNEHLAIAGGDSSIRILKIGKERKTRF